MSATPPPPAGPNTYATQPPLSPQDEKLWSTLTHIGGIVGFVLFGGGLGWLMPLITFLVFKDRGPFIRAHSRAALNFHLTMVAAAIVGWILTIVLVGFLVLVAVPILVIIFGIIAAVKANQGQIYEYPLAIKFIK